MKSDLSFGSKLDSKTSPEPHALRRPSIVRHKSNDKATMDELKNRSNLKPRASKSLLSKLNA